MREGGVILILHLVTIFLHLVTLLEFRYQRLQSGWVHCTPVEWVAPGQTLVAASKHIVWIPFMLL